MRRELKYILAAGLQTHSLAAFIAHLLTNGVSPLPTLDGHRVVGLVYRYKGKKFTDADLGQDFGWENISQMLGYDEQDDYEILQAVVEVDELLEKDEVLEPEDEDDEDEANEQKRLQYDAELLMVINLLIAPLVQSRQAKQRIGVTKFSTRAPGAS